MAYQLPVFESLTLEQLRNPVWLYDIELGHIHWANNAALSVWEASDLEELTARDFGASSSEAVQQTLQGYLAKFKQGEFIDSWWQISPKGIEKDVFCRFSGARLATSNRVLMLVEAIQSPALSPANQALMTVLFDHSGNLVSNNPPFKRQFGGHIQHWGDLSNAEARLIELAAASRYQPLSIDLLLDSNSGKRWYNVQISCESRSQSQPGGYLLTLSDIHERKTKELKYEEQAQRDPLTGLLNRRGLEQQLEQLGSSTYTLFYIDLDGFKPINDTFGHQQGDFLLSKISDTLRTGIHPEAICARLGGDEFVLVLQHPLLKNESQQFAELILQKISQVHLLPNGSSVAVSASVGIANHPVDGNQLQPLLLCADAAMYQAKRQGRGRWIHYTHGMERQLQRHTQIIKYLEAAVHTDELTLFYQPIVDNHSGQVAIVEALLRWNHPELGPISPLELIGIAVKNGKISLVEQWVINRACADLQRLREHYGNELKVAVNISGSHLTTQAFNQQLFSALARHRCQPGDLVLELTEDVLLPMLEEQQCPLADLVERGCIIAIDDFGTGYSSLAYLNRIPARYVKIDKAFINQLDSDQYTITFIRQLCEKLGMLCIAEGVETPEQRTALEQQQISLHQGYYYAKPSPLEQQANLEGVIPPRAITAPFQAKPDLL